MSSRKLWVALPLPVVAILTIGSVAALRAADAGPASIIQEHGGVCYHTDPSDWNCPDTSGSFQASALNVESVSVTVNYAGGRSQTVKLPEKTDAIFLSAKSMRNFLVRHYRATNQKKMYAVLDYLKRHTNPK